jgi:hypothetical protein
MSEPSSFLDPDMVAIARRASALGVNSDGHLADVFGMDMLEAATSPTGYTAAEAYYALDQATEPSDYMGARNVGTMGLEEAAEIFGAYVEGYKEAIALSDGDTFGGIFSAGRIKRYNKQLDRYKSARDDNDQKKAAKALGRMRALWGRMSSADREGLVSPDKASVPGVEISKQAFPKAAAMDAKMSADDESSTDAADAESNAEEAMGEAFGAGGVKAYKNRKAYIELILRGRADGSLSLSAIEPLYNAIKGKRGLPTPAQVMEGAPVTADMIIPAAKGSQSMMGADDLDIFGAEDLDIFAEANAGNVMGVVFGADGAKDYLNRKAYVEAAVKAVASGRIGKVNLVRLWKAVKGRQGLPSPSEIKSGAVVTLDMIIPPVSSAAEALGADVDAGRKKYVEAAVRSRDRRNYRKVNLWKAVKDRKGLPTPAEFKAGAPITLDMINPAASAPSLPSLAAFGAGGVKEYRKRRRYVEAAIRAVAEGRVDEPVLDELWSQVKGRRGLPSPEKLRAGATITMDMALPPAKAEAPVAMGYSFGDDLPEDDSDIDAELGADDDDADDDMDDLGAEKDDEMGFLLLAASAATARAAARRRRKLAESSEKKRRKADDEDEDLPEDDSDIDAALGADDEDDDDMDEMGSSAIGTRNAYRRNVKDLFQALKRNKSKSVAKNWDQIKRIWAKLTKAERAQVKKPDAILREAGKENMQMMILVTGKTKEQIQRVGKKKPGEVEAPEVEAMGSDLTESMGFDEDLDALGVDEDLDDDLDELGADDDDLDEDLDELGADDDDLDDELDALGADDDLDDDLDDMLGGEDDEDLDDDDFGEDLEQSLDLEMQRALVNRYSGSSQAFPAGNAAPFPPPRMAGQEVF